jgi:hypothetical protein
LAEQAAGVVGWADRVLADPEWDLAEWADGVGDLVRWPDLRLAGRMVNLVKWQDRYTAVGSPNQELGLHIQAVLPSEDLKDPVNNRLKIQPVSMARKDRFKWRPILSQRLIRKLC